MATIIQSPGLAAASLGKSNPPPTTIATRAKAGKTAVRLRANCVKPCQSRAIKEFKNKGVEGYKSKVNIARYCTKSLFYYITKLFFLQTTVICQCLRMTDIG